MLKAKIYIAKSGKEIIRKIYIYIDGLEFKQDFYSKSTIKYVIEYLKDLKIPITMVHANYNCSYMDLPF